MCSAAALEKTEMVLDSYGENPDQGNTRKFTVQGSALVNMPLEALMTKVACMGPTTH